WISVYVSNTPPLLAHAPMEMHHLGSGICSQMRCSTGIIFSEMRPDTISRSDWRGENLSTSEPKREASYFDMKVAIISMPQHAVPKGIGHREFDRAQLMAKPSRVVMTSLILSWTLITLLPFQGAGAQDVRETETQHRHEHQHHLQRARPHQGLPADGERQKENRLDVEKDEQQREDVEHDPERTVGILELVDATFVGFILGPAPHAPGSQKRGEGEPADSHQQGKSGIRQKRIKFGGQSDGSLSAPGRQTRENQGFPDAGGAAKSGRIVQIRKWTRIRKGGFAALPGFLSPIHFVNIDSCLFATVPDLSRRIVTRERIYHGRHRRQTQTRTSH